LDTSLQGYINARVNDALSKLSQAQSSLEQKITQSQNTVQGNLNATTQSLYTRMLPVGSVILWGLSDKDFPDTFQLCDGGSFVYNGRTYRKPDLRGRFALGSGTPLNMWNQPIATGTNHYFGQDGGAERVTLTEAQMPSHQHYSRRAAHGRVQGDKYGVNDSSLGHYDNTSYDATQYKSSFAGDNQSHENMPPYRVLNYIIKVKD
jgi:microcystin-dependent protein